MKLCLFKVTKLDACIRPLFRKFGHIWCTVKYSVPLSTFHGYCDSIHYQDIFRVTIMIVKINYHSTIVICTYTHTYLTSGLMIMHMASHRTFSSKIDYLPGQIKFGQTNLLYIINGKFIKFKENECPDNFQSLS